MESIREKQKRIEDQIRKTEARIEVLKTDFNLFFSGELNIPPEKERKNIEKVIREIQSKDLRSGKLDFLLQNLSSRFYLYNNMWLKKLNDLETGKVNRPSKTPKYEMKEKPDAPASKDSSVSLNKESSFESFYDEYDKMVKKSKKGKGKSKDDLINTIKLKMISENIIDANINLTVNKGKVQIKIKK
ncbi:MAG: hypothetical protein ABFR36_09270 [Acidobacteriota bacterium]